MILGLTSIQRNRGPWLAEWLAFHHLIGFNRFYYYAHMCTDNTIEVLLKLSQKLDIKVVQIADSMDRVQLIAYQHAIQNYLPEVDWMAFFDGDEFLFPTNCDSLPEALAHYEAQPISAVGVYNVTFGSNGHMTEPTGLITENYRRCNSSADFLANRKIKSIVKGRQDISITTCSHIFNTAQGTFDEQGRPVSWGFAKDYIPTYNQFRMNHYICQSYEYFKSFKSTSGHADAGAGAVRSEEWWTNFDQNVEFDTSLERFSDRLKETLAWLMA